MIWYEPPAIAHLPDKQLAAAIGDTTTETNRCYAEFVREPTPANSVAWTNAMGQWLALNAEADHRESGRELRQVLLQSSAVERIQL